MLSAVKNACSGKLNLKADQSEHLYNFAAGHELKHKAAMSRIFLGGVVVAIPVSAEVREPAKMCELQQAQQSAVPAVVYSK